MLMSMTPLARTSFDDKGAHSLRELARKVERAIWSLAPWMKKDKARVGRNVQPGEVVVMLDPSDKVDDLLFKDAKVIRQR